MKGEEGVPSGLISHLLGGAYYPRGVHLDPPCPASLPPPSHRLPRLAHGDASGRQAPGPGSHPGSSVRPTASPPSPAPMPPSGQPVGKCCGSRMVQGPPGSCPLARSAPASPRSRARPPGQSGSVPRPAWHEERCRDQKGSEVPVAAGDRSPRGQTEPREAHVTQTICQQRLYGAQSGQWFSSSALRVP